VLYDTVLEVDARADRHGTPLVRPNRAALLDELRGLHAAGIDCIAIVVLRGDTASVDAYLTPRLARYARHDRGRAGARRARRIALLQRHARPRAVTLAAVLYVLRALVGRPIPLNSGCLGDVTVHLPERSLLNPSPGKAVAGGNVETSQRVVDVLLGALGRAAASQGTMNNVSFGQHDFGYYETIAGGAGAGPGFAGASAVHTHMTNTRITDPEVIEQRFPVRIIEFSVRRGSGGRGQYPGGDGIQREYEFLEPVTVSLLTERRLTAPFGLAGGHPGLPGRNSLNGVDLPGHASFQVVPGDRLRVETPGGGGYGSADG
jgi:5-oxoprolinase (ATP-hydrolysing)